MSDGTNGHDPAAEQPQQNYVDPLQLASSLCLEVIGEMSQMKGPATRRDRLALAEALAQLGAAAALRDIAGGIAFVMQQAQQQGQPASGLVIPR